MRNAYINSVPTDTRLATISQFLKLVPISVIPDGEDVYLFNTKTSAAISPSFISPSLDETTDTYVRVAAFLKFGPLAKSDLITQSPTVLWYKRNAIVMLESALIAHLEEFGSGDYAVRVSRRMWMIASPDDFIS